MIEKIILDYLTANLVATPVYLEVPQSPPSKFVVLEKTGSGRNNKIESATVAIQSYGKSLLEAAKLNETIKHIMENITELPNVSRCDLNSDYNFTDTEIKKYRYQAVFDLVFFS